MPSTLETPETLSISTGEELVAAFQDIEVLRLTTQAHETASTHLGLVLKSQILSAGKEVLGEDTEASQAILAQIGSIAYRRFNVDQLSEEAAKRRYGLTMGLNTIINESLQGRLVVVREVEPDTHAITQVTRRGWDGSTRRSGEYVPEITARIGYATLFANRVLGLYVPKRLGGVHPKATYDVRVVDKEANQLVEIELQ